ncbi:hypothetical protein ACFQJ5_15035 [Halomicroarcula sp. GCM10025324]|uniref:DUF7511 domain-containing protein n=1 Tax=Haloarcula TaxID=2237 RepID=UPI0023E75A99|nr:hypothetical protein [Halomicroarcula sp. ZS-22-S1]
MSADIPGVPELCTAGERSDLDLALSVVEYGDRPDRCTVYPPGLAGDARLSTWLSTDRSALVSLSEME